MWPDLAQYADTCLGPDCAVVLEDDAPFCSAACEAAFVEWARAMEDDYAHQLHWGEL